MMTTEQALIGGITALATAVVHLYWQQATLHKECLKDKAELTKKNSELWKYIWQLEDAVHPSHQHSQSHSGQRRRIREELAKDDREET